MNCTDCVHYCIDDSDGEHFEDACFIFEGQELENIKKKGHCDRFVKDDHFEEMYELVRESE